MMSTPYLTFRRLLVLVLGLALLSACRAQAEAPAQPAESTNPSAPAETGAAFTLGGGDFNLPDPAAGLDALDAYAATLTLTFDGQQAGAPLSWTRTYRMAVAAGAAPARQIEVRQQTGASMALLKLSAAESGSVQYTVENGGECLASDLADVVPLAERWEPAHLLPAVSGAEDDGEESIEGTPAQRYTFDERALGLAGLVSAEGTLWAAADSGRLLRYTLTQQGGEEFFGEGVTGRLTWEYALGALDPAQPPSLPPGCTALSPALDLPLPPGAAEVDSSAGWLAFTTGALPGDVLAFYEALLAEAGWLPGAGSAASTDPSIPGLEGMLDEKTLQELAELQAMQEEDWLAEMGDEPAAPSAADPASAVTAVFHREALELTLTIIPQDGGPRVLLSLIEP